MIELRHNRRPQRVLYKNQLGSLVAVVESPGSETTFPRARRGMVMVNAQPSTTNKDVANPCIAVCRGFWVADLIWMAKRSDNACMHVGTPVGVHTGSIALSACVQDITFSYNKLTRAMRRLESGSNSVV